MTITPERVAELRAKATLGPCKVLVAGTSKTSVLAVGGVPIARFYAGRATQEQMDLIAAAPDMADLIAAQAAEIERLRGGLSDLIDHVEAINSEWDAIALQEARQSLKDQTQ